MEHVARFVSLPLPLESSALERKLYEGSVYCACEYRHSFITGNVQRKSPPPHISTHTTQQRCWYRRALLKGTSSITYQCSERINMFFHVHERSRGQQLALDSTCRLDSLFLYMIATGPLNGKGHIHNSRTFPSTFGEIKQTESCWTCQQPGFIIRTLYTPASFLVALAWVVFGTVILYVAVLLGNVARNCSIRTIHRRIAIVNSMPFSTHLGLGVR